MAVGDGGFKQVAFGFDKNEVNTYISDLRKKTKAMEDEMKASQKKAEEALKLADEADDRIKAAVKEVQDKADEIQSKLDAEERRSADLEKQLDDMKAELEKERKNMSEMLKSGKGVSAEAQKTYTEIINKANADANDIIAEANAKADTIVADANNRCAETNKNTTAFLELFRTQLEAFGENYKTIAESAADMLGTSVATAPVIAMPKAAAPAAVVAPVVTEEAAEDTVKEEPEEASPSEEISLEEMLASAEKALSAAEEEEVITEIKAEEPAIKIVASSEAMPDISDAADGDAPASFDDVWGGSELAQTIYNDEKKDAVPLVNPDAKNIFGQDIFNLGDNAEADTPAETITEETIDEIKPLDVSDIAEASFDSGFDSQLLSQTMSSSSLGSDVDDDLLAAVKAAEETFAVKPNEPNVSELDMDEADESSAPLDTEDELMKALREAEEALNSLAPSENIIDETPAQTASAGDDPWADLQKQLEAMEQSGISGDTDMFTQAEPDEPAEPMAPSADDSSIWDFGGGSSSDSDDDMSSDFGGFGGF